MKIKVKFVNEFKNDKDEDIAVFVDEFGDYIRINKEYSQVKKFEEGSTYIVRVKAVPYGDNKAFLAYNVVTKLY